MLVGGEEMFDRIKLLDSAAGNLPLRKVSYYEQAQPRTEAIMETTSD
jgi:hypothetical protein